MTRLGIFLKKLRIDNGEVLFDMAKRINVSSAFLSAVENGRKPAPSSWIDAITVEYGLNEEQRTELDQLLSESVKQIRVDISGASGNKRQCALAFARRFDDFSDGDIEALLQILNREKN